MQRTLALYYANILRSKPWDRWLFIRTPPLWSIQLWGTHNPSYARAQGAKIRIHSDLKWINISRSQFFFSLCKMKWYKYIPSYSVGENWNELNQVSQQHSAWPSASTLYMLTATYYHQYFKCYHNIPACSESIEMGSIIENWQWEQESWETLSRSSERGDIRSWAEWERQGSSALLFSLLEWPSLDICKTSSSRILVIEVFHPHSIWNWTSHCFMSYLSSCSIFPIGTCHHLTSSLLILFIVCS